MAKARVQTVARPLRLALRLGAGAARSLARIPQDVTLATLNGDTPGASGTGSAVLLHGGGSGDHDHRLHGRARPRSPA